MIFLNMPCDIQWAREVHKLDIRAKSFILYGNEDCPQKIEWFTKKIPKYNEVGTTVIFYE